MTTSSKNVSAYDTAHNEAPEQTERPPEIYESDIPAPAKWLGYLGVIPFIVIAAGGMAYPQIVTDQAAFALAAYGSIILSFLGGIHWGLAISAPVASGPLSRRLIMSVVPALTGWVSLLLTASSALLMLAGAFLLMLIFDFLTAGRGETPDWYPRLRWPLTLAAVVSLILGTSI